MKKRIIIVLIAISILISLLAIPSSAAQIVMFTAVDDTLMTMAESTMPTYFGTRVYAHMGLFQSAGITITTSSKTNLYASLGRKRLNFSIASGDATDQDGTLYSTAAAKPLNGSYYLPVDFMCEFFEISYVVHPADPVSVLRLKTANAVFNDKTFVSHYQAEMQSQYDAYIASQATPTPPPRESDDPETTRYRDITIYLSFYATSAGETADILDTLKSHAEHAIFFMTAGEIVRDPDLVRRISGEGHMLGVWLETADADALAHANRLFFEAAFTKTVFVSSPADTRAEVRELASELGLIYLAPTTTVSESNSASAVIRALPTTANARAELRFAASENSARILPTILAHMRANEYNVRPVTETHHI